MNSDRIAELLSPYLGPTHDVPFNERKLFSSISTYIDLLIRWNARMNLTAIRDPEEIVIRHFGESLFAARHLFPSGSAASSKGMAEQRQTTTLADLGSGAGFPGIPIKLWAPDLSLTLIESNQKKSVFLREVVRSLTLTDVNIQNARAESLPAASFDVVTLRAVEKFPTVLPTAASLVVAGGRLALLIGTAQLDEAKRLLPDFHSSPKVQVPNSTSSCLMLSVRGEPKA